MSFAEGYIDVATRIAEFYGKYPDGSLQMDDPQWVEVDGQQLIWARAYAYRTPDDPRPGIGHAWELVPGRTPYTRGSELMNLETSCWGRCLAALGIGTKQGIATSDEIRAAEQRQHPASVGQGTGPQKSYTKPSPLVSEKQLAYLRQIMQRQNVSEYVLADFCTEVLHFELPKEMDQLTKKEASAIIDALTKKVDKPVEMVNPWESTNGETSE